jgi:oligoribonuclease NrnB/cAMP/cGMP phosphodiesterase (DHH superfamily)
MKTVCIYHRVDLDGWMSAGIVKYWFISNNKNYIINGTHVARGGFINHNIWDDPSITFIGYHYGDPIPDLTGYDKVIMVDISFPVMIMNNLMSKLVWIDHHISAIGDNDFQIKGLRNDEFAACELAWQYFFPDTNIPEIVRLLGRYDCFGHKGTDEELKVLEFQYGARARIRNYNEAYDALLATIELPSRLNDVLREGIQIYRYLKVEAKSIYNKGFEWNVFTNIEDAQDGKSNFKFICFNSERFNPVNFGIDYHADGYDGAACFWYQDSKWQFSLYNDNGKVDVSLIAKQFGGGGHAGASGFIVNDLKDAIWEL